MGTVLWGSWTRARLAKSDQKRDLGKSQRGLFKGNVRAERQGECWSQGMLSKSYKELKFDYDLADHCLGHMLTWRSKCHFKTHAGLLAKQNEYQDTDSVKQFAKLLTHAHTQTHTNTLEGIINSLYCSYLPHNFSLIRFVKSAFLSKTVLLSTSFLPSFPPSLPLFVHSFCPS